MKPLCIDLFCGLGGWAEGFLAEGWTVIGFDIERHDYGTGGYPGLLVLQDVLTLHGSQFKDADVIVASPPCQAYSYRAMPWKRAKALPPPDNTLFEACFKIQQQACEAAGRYIPLIVENVRGAQKWVGRSRWHYGSFYLWGDVPALMPIGRHVKVESVAMMRSGYSHARHLTAPREHIGLSRVGFNVAAAREYRKTRCHELHLGQSRMDSRKAASAQIAKIPRPLSTHIARVFKQAVRDEAVVSPNTTGQG